MSSTKKNQNLQIRQSQTFDDTLDISTAEVTSASLETDLNYLRSQLKNIIGEPAWNIFPASTIKDLSQQIGSSKNVVYYSSEFMSIPVPLSANFVALNSPGYPPSVNIALSATSIGAICAILPIGSGSAHSTLTAVNEGNVVLIRDADTNDKIIDKNGEIIFGLLQVDVGSSDGSAFALTGANSAQISLVSKNPSTELYEAVSIPHVEGRSIEYAYKLRQTLVDSTEDFTIQNSDFIRSPHIKLNTEELTIASDGDTIFLLQKAYVDNGDARLWVNGVEYHKGIDFNINDTILTWLDIKFTLETTDQLVITYQVS